MAKPIQKAAANKLSPERQKILDMISSLSGMFDKSEEEPVGLPEDIVRLKDENTKVKKVKPSSGKTVLVEDRFGTGMIMPEEEESDFKAKQNILGEFEKFQKNVEGVQNIVDLLTIGGGVAGKVARNKMDASKALRERSLSEKSKPSSALKAIAIKPDINTVESFSENPIVEIFERKLRDPQHAEVRKKITDLFDAVIDKEKEQYLDSQKPDYKDKKYDTKKTINIYDVLSVVYDLEKPKNKNIENINDFNNESPSFKAQVMSLLDKINTGRDNRSMVFFKDLFNDIPVYLESQQDTQNKAGSFTPSLNIMTMTRNKKSNMFKTLLHELVHAVNRYKYLDGPIESTSIFPVYPFENADPGTSTHPFFSKQQLFLSPSGEPSPTYAEQETYMLGPINKFSYLKTGNRLNDKDNVEKFGRDLEKNIDLQKELIQTFVSEMGLHRAKRLSVDDYMKQYMDGFLKEVMPILIEKLKTDDKFKIRVIQEAKAMNKENKLKEKRA